jgi:hypothetical protein
MKNQGYGNQRYNDGPMGGVAIFIGTLIVFAAFIFFAATARIDIGSNASPGDAGWQILAERP